MQERLNRLVLERREQSKLELELLLEEYKLAALVAEVRRGCMEYRIVSIAGHIAVVGRSRNSDFVAGIGLECELIFISRC